MTARPTDEHLIPSCIKVTAGIGIASIFFVFFFILNTEGKTIDLSQGLL